jgi:hypothetical protein
MTDPKFYALASVLHDKLFIIPDYQRHYSWRTEEREDLFGDIKRLQEFKKQNKKRIHFMATIVCLNRGDDPVRVDGKEFHYYEVVDGQQRLTTLIILLKSISIKLKEYKRKAHEDIDAMMVRDNNNLIILQNNFDHLEILTDYLKSGKKPRSADMVTQADINLEKAILECDKFLAQYPSPDDLMDLLFLINNSLYFTFQETDDEGAVYTIFEVLNSRGLAVDWLDKCKSLLMGLLFEYGNPPSMAFENTRIALCNLWTHIYKGIGLHNIPGSEIVSFAATLLDKQSQAGRPHSAEDALRFFRKDCTKDSDSNNVIKSILETTKFLKDITTCLAELSEKKMEAVTDIAQARLLAVSIKLKEDLSDEEKRKLLEQWEHTTFKNYGFCGKDARDHIGLYVGLAKIIQRDSSKSFKDLLPLIAAIGKEDLLEEAVIAWGRQKDVYNKSKSQSQLRYFFYKYEEYLIAEAHRECKKSELDPVSWSEIWKQTAHKSREHVLPQTWESTHWRDYFTDSDCDNLLHSIGNLCLVPPSWQQKLSNNPFSEKLSVYREVKLELVKKMINDDNGKELLQWDKNAIERRREKLIEFAKDQWKDL